jgi:hypothetical protein
MRGSLGVAPNGTDGPFDVTFSPDGKNGPSPKYSAKDFAELERILASFKVKLTEEQVKNLESDGISIPNLDPSDDVLKQYGLS